MRSGLFDAPREFLSPFAHRLELGLRLDLRPRPLGELGVGLVEIEALRERLRDVEGRVDETFDPVALAVVEVERPGVAVADRKDRFDARRRERRADLSQIVEASRSKREVVDHHEAGVGDRLRRPWRSDDVARDPG